MVLSDFFCSEAQITTQLKLCIFLQSSDESEIRFRNELVRSFSLPLLPNPDVEATRPSVPFRNFILRNSQNLTSVCSNDLDRTDVRVSSISDDIDERLLFREIKLYVTGIYRYQCNTLVKSNLGPMHVTTTCRSSP